MQFLKTPLWVIVAWLAGSAAAVAQPEPVRPEFLADAELTCVTFVDADRGWCCGDRGVIWHTADGGRTWKPQNSGVTCRLEAIQFLDAEIGFAVGGWTQPYTHTTHGVALRTRDGGKSWQLTPDLTLPGLRQVRFFDARRGWAVGDSSALFTAGVFKSEDGGRTWSPLPKGESAGYAAGDFREGGGALAGLKGDLAVISGSETKPSRTPNLGARGLRRLTLVGDAGGWLVGDGGLVLTTADRGYSWTTPPGALPEAAARGVDFRALAVQGTNVWMAGAPGSCVLHSPDNGQNWQLYRTDHSVPLCGLTFIDEYRGWAVGSLGTILHTRDGGRSWRVQRSGGTRVALLGIFGEAARVPLELVADQAGNSGYLTAVEIVGRPEAASLLSGAPHSLARRVHGAVVATGGSGADMAWRFPLPDMNLQPASEAILARWNAASDGQAAQRLEEHLVRRIRQWRPETIVTEDVSPRGENPLAYLTNQMVLAAVTKAADEAAFAEQLSDLGLTPWRIKKVLATLPTDKQGVVNITPAQWAERLGRSLSEQAEGGRGLLLCDVGTSPRNLGLSVLIDRLPHDSGKRDVMSGIVLTPGGEARRLLSDPPAGDLRMLAAAAQKRHNVEQLLSRIDANPTGGANWLGQIRDLTAGLSGKSAGDLLWQLGRKYQQTGKLQQAAEAMQLLMDKHPQHPLADAAALWLVQYYASGEAGWRDRRETRSEVRLATAITPEEAAEASRGEGKVRQAVFASMGEVKTAAPDLAPAERAGRALKVAKQIEQTRPTLYAEESLRFSLAAAAKQAGQPRVADRIFQQLAAGAADSPWTNNAQAEQWLIRPSGNGPKKVCSAITAPQKPKLDGRLDDATWQFAKPVALQSGPSAPSPLAAAAVFAHDDEFLYIAISCQKAPGVAYRDDQAPRVPDSDLSERDRVQIMLDIDRDYATYWSLAVDHRGAPADRCVGDVTWNPPWFIATGGDEQFWTIEAAIPLVELAAARPQVRDVWAVGIQRIVPGHVVQSFTQPATAEMRPEAMGLLVFE